MIKNRPFGVVTIGARQNSFILQNAGTMAVTSHCWDGGSVVQYSLMNIPGTSPDPIVNLINIKCTFFSQGRHSVGHW